MSDHPSRNQGNVASVDPCWRHDLSIRSYYERFAREERFSGCGQEQRAQLIAG